MHAGQVIALKIIVNVGLPIAFHVVRPTLKEFHPGEIETLHLFGKLPQALRQRLGIRVEVDENEVKPLRRTYRCECEIAG